MKKRGKIKQRMPNMVAAANVIAARVAGMVAPNNANDIFSMLKEKVGDRFNSHKSIPRFSGFTSTGVAAENMSKTLKNQLISETRDDLAMRTGLKLPNLAYKPKTGIGTAMQTRPREQEQSEFGDYQVDRSQQQQTRESEMVDDAGWSLTLNQTVGSGMISAAQFKAASFDNVSAMIGYRTEGFNGAQASQLSASQKKEMTYMLQRMILEGYVRGIDVPAMIKGMPGGKLDMSVSDGSGLGLGVAGHSVGVMLDNTWWNKASDVDKIGLFYQEVGHALGVADHTRGLMKGSDTIFSADSTAKDNYAKYVDWYFQDVKSESRYDVASSSNGALSAADAQALLSQNPSWIPSLEGGVIPTSQPEPKPSTAPAVIYSNGGGATASQAMQAINTISNARADVSMSQQQQMQSSQASRPMEQAATPTMPGGLDSSVMTATKTFAAGMADISKPNDANIMENAGALLRSG